MSTAHTAGVSQHLNLAGGCTAFWVCGYVTVMSYRLLLQSAMLFPCVPQHQDFLKVLSKLGTNDHGLRELSQYGSIVYMN